MPIKRKNVSGLTKILDDLKTIVQNALLPTGSIVWFHGRTTAPSGWAICDGTNGTPNLIGRYPLGAKTGIGSSVEAGLPNITGGFSIDNKDPASNYKVTGSFTKTNPGGIGVPTGHRVGEKSNADYSFPVYFNAQLSSAIYGKSSTVTPPSVKLLPCMKL